MFDLMIGEERNLGMRDEEMRNWKWEYEEEAMY